MEPPATNRAQWEHNRSFLLTITDDFSDWLVNVAFYAAVHCVECAFAYDKLQPATSHDVRNRILKTTSSYLHIWRHYRPLLDASISTRYYVGKKTWITTADAKSKFIGHHLLQIEKSVSKLTKQDPPEKIEWSS